MHLTLVRARFDLQIIQYTIEPPEIVYTKKSERERGCIYREAIKNKSKSMADADIYACDVYHAAI